MHTRTRPSTHHQPSRVEASPEASRRADRPHDRHETSHSPSGAPRCPCGGGCPKCQSAVTDAGRRLTPTPAVPGTIPNFVRDVLHASGQPLDATTRAYLEPRFGHDLGDIRVHTDTRAAASARAVHAKAYTVGQDVVFGEGRYAPATPAGRELLAHELTHAIQQCEPAGAPPSNDPNAIDETTARTVASQVARGETAPQVLPRCSVGMARSPDDDEERAKAIAEAESLIARMEEESKNADDEEAESTRQGSAFGRPTTLSLIKPDPRQISDEEIYRVLATSAAQEEEERTKAAEEAEAVIASMEAELKVDEQEDLESSQERSAFGPTTLSLLKPDPRQISDEEIYESIREPKPDEPEYWERQEPEWLEKGVMIADETKYVRRWRSVLVEGVGDQGDRHVDVEDSYWKMSRSGLRGYILYMAGDLTPFEESIVAGTSDVLNQFTPVPVGDKLGYYVVTGGSGNREHTIYNRDGTIAKRWYTEEPLVNEGIGPLALALPGVGVRGLPGSAARLARAGIQTGKRLMRPAGVAAQRAIITTKLALGRAQAGAAAAEATALAGTASKTPIALVERQAVAQTAQRTIAPPTIPPPSPTAVAQPIQSTTPATSVASQAALPSTAPVLPSVANAAAAAGNLTSSRAVAPDDVLADFMNRLAATDNPFSLNIGAQRAQKIMTGEKDFALDAPVAFDIDEPLAVGDPNIKPQRAVARALDPHNRQLLDPQTNRLTKHLREGTADVARHRQRLPAVSLQSDPNALLIRRFDEVTELNQVFREAVARVRNPGVLTATELKNAINKNVREIIRDGSTAAGRTVRDTLRNLGFDYIQGRGFVAVR